MKRIKKMTELNQITERLLMEQTAPAFRAVMLKALPERFFGEAVAAHIQHVEVINQRLILYVPEPVWQKEITQHTDALLADARRLEPALAGIMVMAGVSQANQS